MALANDDIWQKFDLFAVDSKAAGKSLENLGSMDDTPYLSGSNLSQSSLVPDISDLLFNFGVNESPLINAVLPNLPLQVESVENIISLPECDHILDLPFVDLETLDSSEALRHDCMWSGLCPSEEHRLNHVSSKPKEKPSSTRLEVVSTPSDLQTSACQISVFDTPIQSDLEGSDLDETLSDIDVEETDDGGGLDLSEGSGGDHTYTSVHSLTPAQSEEEEEGCTLLGTNVQNRSLAQQGKGTQTGPTIRIKPPGPGVFSATKKTSGLNEAKFKFQVKFMSGMSSTSKSRSLLRHSSRPDKLHSGLKQKVRKGAVRQNIFNSTSRKRIQVHQGKVTNQRQVVREKGRDVRDLHNSMERQRRVDLKNAFDSLKICVPGIAETDRASKLMILDRAADFCQELIKRETILKTEKENEARRNMLLNKKLNMLRTLSKMSLQKCTRKVFL